MAVVGRRCLLSLIILCGLAAIGSARATDFSGRWTSDPEPAPAAPAPRPSTGDMGSGWGATITITQDTARLTVEYAFFARGDLQPPMRFVYALDGSESRNSVMMGRGIQVQASKAVWVDEALVITTVHTFADPSSGRPAAAEVKQTLRLESPASLLVETTRAGVFGGPPSTTRTRYRKI